MNALIYQSFDGDSEAGLSRHAEAAAAASIASRFLFDDDIWNACARLLTNAIIYLNSLILSNLLAYYRTTADRENLELVRKVSPVAWLKVNPNGTCRFTFEQNMITMAEIPSPLTGESGQTKK